MSVTVNTDDYYLPEHVECMAIKSHMVCWRRLLVRIGLRRFEQYQVTYGFIARA